MSENNLENKTETEKKCPDNVECKDGVCPLKCPDNVECKDGVCTFKPKHDENPENPEKPCKRKMRSPGELDTPSSGTSQFDQIFSQLFSSVLNQPDNGRDINPLAAWQQMLGKNPELCEDDPNCSEGDDEEDEDEDEDDDDDEDEGEDVSDEDDCCHLECHRDAQLESFNKLLESHVNITHAFFELVKRA